MAETWPEMIRAWPKTTLCIVSNEFCERFSYYGMQAILLLYFLNVLNADYSTAIVGTNGFTVICFIMPLPGSILADAFIGKFRTIFILSIVYAFGQVSCSIIYPQTRICIPPLRRYCRLIYNCDGHNRNYTAPKLTTHGIKPCVASFGADQFDPHQTKMISVYFSVFYFAINAGAMITTFVSPLFRVVPSILLVNALFYMDLNQNSSTSEPPNDYGLYVWFMRLNAILDTLISILVIYLIFKHTPKAMKVYKWFLLNLSLCCYILDAHITIMFVPIPIFPVFGGCALGLMKPFGYMAPVIAWIIFVQLVCFTQVSIYLALLYRLAALYGHGDIFERKFVIAACIAFQCAFGIPVLISGIDVYLPEEQSMAYMQQNYPNLIPFYQSHSCAVMMANSEMLEKYGYTMLPTGLSTIFLNVVVAVLLARRLAKVKHTVSAKTYKMHKSLSVSLCFQFALPAFMLICSEIIVVVATILQWKSAQTIFYACFLFSTMHTAANGIIMIAFVKPYRMAFFGLLMTIRQKMTHLVVGPEPMTRSIFALPATTGKIILKRKNLMRRLP